MRDFRSQNSARARKERAFVLSSLECIDSSVYDRVLWARQNVSLSGTGKLNCGQGMLPKHVKNMQRQSFLLTVETTQLTNDFVEASSWASTVEETLRTSGTAFNFSFSIVTIGRQFVLLRCPIVLCFSVLLCAGRKPQLTERLAFIPQRPLSTSTIDRPRFGCAVGG